MVWPMPWRLAPACGARLPRPAKLVYVAPLSDRVRADALGGEIVSVVSVIFRRRRRSAPRPPLLGVLGRPGKGARV
jgi:hypothetical protein